MSLISEHTNVALLTQHGKQVVISKIFKDEHGMNVVHDQSYDTDLFGTFTGEIRRINDQASTARAKARKGMLLTGLSRGLGSEGSFGFDPYAGILPWDRELVVYIDDVLDITLTGYAQNYAQAYSAVISANESLDKHLKKAAFPAHQLVLKPSKESAEIVKGIGDINQLSEAVKWAKVRSGDKSFYIENDLRAHANPTRMLCIESAVVNLSAQLKSTCPECQMPGFWVRQHIAGLECRECGAETGQVKFRVWGCIKCQFEHIEHVKKKFAPAEKCDFCNP